MTASATGVVVAGYGVASGRAGDSPFAAGTIELQAPHFRARGLELSAYLLATVNVDLAPWRLVLREPRWTFADVEWTRVHPPETFSFVECTVTRDGAAVDGLVTTRTPRPSRCTTSRRRSSSCCCRTCRGWRPARPSRCRSTRVRPCSPTGDEHLGQLGIDPAAPDPLRRGPEPSSIT
ncbi:hypothetical protein ACWDHH_02555 [Janibacter hoylei]